jgi:hypothetical protein
MMRAVLFLALAAAANAAGAVELDASNFEAEAMEARDAPVSP